MSDTLFPASDLSRWNGLPATKFRAPQARRDLVERPQLLERAQRLVRMRRVTLVWAPAGFGKSTLLVQLINALEGQAQVVWLSLDADDNDCNRLFVSLLTALRDVPLEWELAPRLLASQVQGAGLQTRAAVAALANTLSTFEGERLLLVLDDLHCISDEAALQLLADLIERLPPEVGVVLASRVEPALPLARWRVRGEMGEILHADLQFNAHEAQALASLRQADTGAQAFSNQFIQQALQRTQGWVAGLSLVLGVSSGQLVTHLQSAVDKVASRHLFDFFAQEVLAELPEELCEFVLRCAVLPELSPRLCQAVTGRADAHNLLEILYRRNLFLTALDETLPVLRFHDLFAEFLLNQLERLHPGLAMELHRAAAQAEDVPLRAVTHWLKAGAWEEAISEMQRCIQPLLAEGGYALVQRWIAQIPAEVAAQRADVASLHAQSAWASWDFENASQWLERACAGYQQEGRTEAYLSHFALLPRAYNSVGLLQQAERALLDAESLPLTPRSRVICLGAKTWQEIAMGRPEGVAVCLEAIADAVERDPSLLVPTIDDMFNSFMFGFPGVYTPASRLQALCRIQLSQPAVPWQVEVFAQASWLAFWRGDRAAVRAAVAQQSALQARLSILPMLRLNARQAEAWEAAALGQHERALQCQHAALAAMAELNIAGLTATWRRATTHNLAQLLWRAQDEAALRALWPYLSPARSAVEWPFIDTARAHLAGQLALLDQRYDDAEHELLLAATLQTRWPMPTFIGDVRITLAWLRYLQKQPQAAWAVLSQVLNSAYQEDCIGPLLIAPVSIMDQLLSLIPASERLRYQPLLARLSDWRVESTAAVGINSMKTSVLLELSEREREVLAHIAAGDSNKLIARALDLSPHTVKRHVANILDKLNCRSRGQAAALWRAHQ
ncbi:MAG TPA: LuxR C-terminal-related transcriptional regulator [Pseudomonadales bacterium]|nr:LuxR C-terminal-related transcriptional regulator [Pseudomonadales bacterium]